MREYAGEGGFAFVPEKLARGLIGERLQARGDEFGFETLAVGGAAEVVTLLGVASAKVYGESAGGHRHGLHGFVAAEGAAFAGEDGRDVFFERHLDSGTRECGLEADFQRRCGGVEGG